MSADTHKIKVGISSCLLGEKVRYNGGHKQSTLCTELLARWFDYVPTCPELGAGLGVPRATIRLVGDPRAPRVVEVERPEIEVTDVMLDYAQRRIPELHSLCGYIFMRNSPSCGMFRVKVYQESGYPHPDPGQGVFARALSEAMPLLPVEEDGRLQDPVLRENFVTRVFAMHNWQQVMAKGLTRASLIDFHSRYKYTLMAHDPVQQTALGRMLAEVGKHDPEVLGPRFFAALMQVLQRKATRRTNTNVLMHLQGYLKKQLQPREKQSMTETIEHYRQGIVPLVVPVTVLRHHFHQHQDDYISRQTFLQPYPDALGLRNAL